MKYTFKKYYKLISTSLAFVMNSIGLILAFIGAFSGQAFTKSETFITCLLVAAEIFLIVATVYSVISIIKNVHNQVSVDQKEAELLRYRDTNKTIFENNKASITCYKDFRDKLNMLVSNYTEEQGKIENLSSIIGNSNEDAGPMKDALETYLTNTKSAQLENMQKELTELYNRFIINIITNLQESIEKYLRTKNCNASVSIALKQLDQPTKYSQIDDKKNNIYTAFRDKKTYNSKTRNETWKKAFSIHRNSDFVFSIEKDYYIFNCVTKLLCENGLYLNENTNFYEYYNSGVTCTVYSCVDQERILYGFLACDSLIDKKTTNNGDKDIYDYNVANLMMSTAHIIALFLGKFLETWDRYIASNVLIPPQTPNRDDVNNKGNFCNMMIDRVNTSRYRG